MFYKNDKIRIERSPYLNGHFYLRILKNNETNLNLSTTIGFGYDEPYREESILLSNIFVVSLQMLNAIAEPVHNKWIIYKNDHPRNMKLFPNTYHIVTEWFNMTETTSSMIRDLYNGVRLKIFEKPFSPISNETCNNCRSILLEILSSSLSIDGINEISKYLLGNPLLNDEKYGCVLFKILVNGDIKKEFSHPCMYNLCKSCCNSVNRLERTERIEVCIE